MLFRYSISHVALLLVGVIGVMPPCLLAQGDTSSNSTTDLMECPLCADPTHVPQDPGSLFTSGDSTFRCDTAHELGTLELPVDNCIFWQSRGATICQCAASPPEPNECTLCESGEALPNPLLGATPDRVCAQVQVDARRDSSERCIVYQQTMGLYCGCDNPQATSPSYEICRVCGGEEAVPISTLEVLSVTLNETSCGELEFDVNLLPWANCALFQLLYGEVCCPVTSAPTQDPGVDDGALGLGLTTVWMYLAGISYSMLFLLY